MAEKCLKNIVKWIDGVLSEAMKPWQGQTMEAGKKYLAK